jgi:hypothetical protein
MLKTVITTLQGVSALYVLVGTVSGAALPGTTVGFGVDTIFFPLAILGLVRLCAATWLTEDFVYREDGLRDTSSTETATQAHQRTTTKDNDIDLDDHSRALDPLIPMPSKTAGFRSPSDSWRSRFFRIFFLLLIGGFWTMALLLTTPVLGGRYFSATTFLLSLFYLSFATVSLVLYTFYFVRGQTTTTILPCISSMWYRLYILLLMGLMMTLMVIASIETNRSPTGVYASVDLGNKLACANVNEWYELPLHSRWMGLAVDKELEERWLTRNLTSLPVKGIPGTGSQNFWLYNFTGYCMGDFNDM